MTICLFMPTGRTFTFKNCKDVVDNENILAFNYTAMSDAKQKRGIFQKSQIVGYSVEGK